MGGSLRRSCYSRTVVVAPVLRITTTTITLITLRITITTLLITTTTTISTCCRTERQAMSIEEVEKEPPPLMTPLSIDAARLKEPHPLTPQIPPRRR